MTAKKIARRLGIGCGGLLAVLAVLAVGLMVLALWQPWAPEITVTGPATGGQRVEEAHVQGR